MNAVKVRVLVGGLELGGTEKYLATLLPRLKEFGLNVTVVLTTRKYHPVLYNLLISQGVTIKLPPRWMNFKFFPPKLKGLLRILAMITWFGFDMVYDKREVTHFYLSEPFLLGMLAAKLVGYKGKTIFSRRGLTDQLAIKYGSRIEKWLYKDLDFATGNNSEIVQQFIANGAPKRKVLLQLNGIEVGKYKVNCNKNKIRASLGLEENELVFVTVSRIHPLKRHIDIIEALASIKAKLPADWKLLIVGGDCGEKSKLVEASHALGIETNLLWLGSRQDIPHILAISDIGLFASASEGMPNTVLEYMSAGLPMVVSNIQGCRELIEHKHQGLLFEAGNVASLSEEIIMLIENEAEMHMLGQNALKKVEKEFSLEVAAKFISNLYLTQRNQSMLAST